jgi:hypothetical protein
MWGRSDGFHHGGCRVVFFQDMGEIPMPNTIAAFCCHDNVPA